MQRDTLFQWCIMPCMYFIRVICTQQTILFSSLNFRTWLGTDCVSVNKDLRETIAPSTLMIVNLMFVTMEAPAL